jgi:hypothetical protein
LVEVAVAAVALVLAEILFLVEEAEAWLKVLMEEHMVPAAAAVLVLDPTHLAAERGFRV